MNYVLIGATINNLMLCDKIIKNGDECIIYEKRNINEFYKNCDNINSQLFFSSNDVNFIEWLKSINLNEYDAGIHYDLSFNFIKQFKFNEINNIFHLFSNSIVDEKMLKEQQLIVYLKNKNFCNESIEYIKKFCNFFNKKYDIINLYDFMYLVNSKLFGEYYIINKTALIKKIFKNTNVEKHILWSREIMNTNFNNKIMNTNFNNKKVIFDIKPENIKKININIEDDKVYKSNLYNLYWDSKIEFPLEFKNDLIYFDITNNFTLNNHVITDDITDINNKLYFLDKPSNVKVFENTYLKENIINKNIIFLKKSKIIEDDIMNSLYILQYTNPSYLEMFKIYKNDTIIDIAKLYLCLNFCLKLFKF
jgi:hypothetical protein